MVWGDIMTSFGPMCVITSAIARSIPIFKLEYFWNAKTYTGEILIWCHIDGVLSGKHQNTHNLNCLFFNCCLGWKFKNCWNDWYILPSIDYCLTIWGNAPKCHLDRILKFQKYAARIILDAPPDSTSEPLFKKVGWLNTVKGFNFAVLKVRGFLDGTFRGGFNFADYSIATYN